MFKKALLSFASCRNPYICKRHASQIGFIGIGNMGVRMARNLIKKGSNVKVYDVVPENAKAVEGATVCNSPAEAAKGSSIVITMLPNCEISKNVILGENGVIGAVSPNDLVIDMSTVEPKTAQDISEALSAKKIRFIDAPVSGGTMKAEDGTLTIMVGGQVEDLKTAEPVLLKMGARVFHCGNVGSGQIAKLCNNLILGITMMGTSEGYNLAMKLGLDPEVFTKVLNVSTGMSWTSVNWNPVPGILASSPASQNYDGGFMVKLMAKDMGLAEKAAVTAEAPVPLGGTAHQIYRAIIANGYGNKDISSIFKFFQGEKK